MRKSRFSQEHIGATLRGRASWRRYDKPTHAFFGRKQLDLATGKHLAVNFLDAPLGPLAGT